MYGDCGVDDDAQRMRNQYTKRLGAIATKQAHAQEGTSRMYDLLRVVMN